MKRPRFGIDGGTGIPLLHGLDPVPKVKWRTLAIVAIIHAAIVTIVLAAAVFRNLKPADADVKIRVAFTMEDTNGTVRTFRPITIVRNPAPWGPTHAIQIDD
jgi:hypothetical protein